MLAALKKMGKRKPRQAYGRKRRKFYGNQHSSTHGNEEMPLLSSTPRPSPAPSSDINDEEASDLQQTSCSSAKKLNLDVEGDLTEDQDDYYVLINFAVLKNVLAELCNCIECGGSIELQNDLQNRNGFACKFSVRCTKCTWIERFYSSQTTAKNSESPASGRSSFDVNIRAMVAFREIGKGYEGMSNFATFMNLPPPLSKTGYNKINNKLNSVYKEVAEKSCQEAAKETRIKLGGSADGDDMVDCQVSVDGSWQKRGHMSLNGVVTLVSRENGKCLDFSILSKKCKGCQYWSKRKSHPGYNSWLANHDCQINHQKSSGAMESAGAITMFADSIKKHNLRYTSYIGDGDSSSFKLVQESKPYGDNVEIIKKECIGHVQKRMGSRCRTLRQAKKSVTLSDGKKIGGRGRLTDKAINTLQNHYGMAIRQNIDNMYAMKKAIIAVMHHSSDIANEEERHKYCPRTKNGWCKWWTDKLNGEKKYKTNINLPLAVMEELKPIFRDLSSDDLLSRCLHGQTQNENECLNAFIWRKCPKEVYVSRKVIEIGSSSAVIEFNDGKCGAQKIFKALGMTTGRFTRQGCIKKDRVRISNSGNKSMESTKKRRKQLRAQRKGFTDKEKENEGEESYASGKY